MKRIPLSLAALALLTVPHLVLAHEPLPLPVGDALDPVRPQRPQGLHTNLVSDLPCADGRVLYSPERAGHDHSSGAHHGVHTSNFQLVKHENPYDSAYPMRLWSELDGYGDGYVLHAFFDDFFETGGGFWVYDVSDPANYRLAGVFHALDGAWGTDVKASKAGPFAFLGGSSGIAVVDMSDPSNPVERSRIAVDDVVPGATQAHMITTHLIGGVEYVFSASQTNGAVHVFRHDAGVLTYVTTYWPVPGNHLGPHDTFVMDDPVLGIPLLYVAGGFAGIFVADVSDPANPKTLTVTSDAAFGYADYHHSVFAVFVEGRRLVVTSPENAVSPNLDDTVKIFDATDLPVILPLGTWTAPFGSDATHNLQYVDGYLFNAHYHDGVWAMQFDSLKAAENPPNLGYWIPGNATARLGVPFGHSAPAVWDVYVKNGVVYAGDINGGLYAARFSCVPFGDPAVTSWS